MFKVEIKNLKTKAYIGIPNKERVKPQPLTVTLSFKYSIVKNNQLDDIRFLKDYSTITKSLKFFVENSCYKSLEKLVAECSNEMKKKIHALEIEIK